MKKIYLLICMLGLSGCTEITQYMQDSLCTPNSAFAHGVNDAKNNKDMETNYASICPIEMREELNDSYRQGYISALRRKNRQFN